MKDFHFFSIKTTEYHLKYEDSAVHICIFYIVTYVSNYSFLCVFHLTPFGQRFALGNSLWLKKPFCGHLSASFPPTCILRTSCTQEHSSLLWNKLLTTHFYKTVNCCLLTPEKNFYDDLSPIFSASMQIHFAYLKFTTWNCCVSTTKWHTNWNFCSRQDLHLWGPSPHGI